MVYVKTIMKISVHALEIAVIKIINIIIVSFLFSNLVYDFQINRGADSSTPSFPESNGIIDIENKLKFILSIVVVI